MPQQLGLQPPPQPGFPQQQLPPGGLSAGPVPGMQPVPRPTLQPLPRPGMSPMPLPAMGQQPGAQQMQMQPRPLGLAPPAQPRPAGLPAQGMGQPLQGGVRQPPVQPQPSQQQMPPQR